MHSEVFSDWLPISIKATRPGLEIFEMAGYSPDSPRNVSDITLSFKQYCLTLIYNIKAYN